MQVTVLWCKECGRYLQPPKHWLRAELESKELLTFCIKKIKGLNKVGGCGQGGGGRGWADAAGMFAGMYRRCTWL
jgi:NMD protein affecting ribosome stability and mRNA decay